MDPLVEPEPEITVTDEMRTIPIQDEPPAPEEPYDEHADERDYYLGLALEQALEESRYI